MTGTFLRIEELTKKFGSFTALSDISLDVFEGEFVCFLGPSGCGKTTLLRAIAGLDIQTQGKIEQDGKDISVLPPAQRDFGIVFQSYALFPNLTVEKNVAYGLESRRNRRAETRKRVEELLTLVDLADQSEKYPAQLSGGQQQRVALARALATAPGLLLLDEPLSALDAKVRAHLRLEIKELQRRLKVTTIMVTHDQEEALTMADRIVVMNQGIIEQVGTPEQIYAQPATEFVAEFIGTMNFVSAQALAGANYAGLGVQFQVKGSSLPEGSRVALAIRPEDVQIDQPGKGADVNAIAAQVNDLEYLGAFVRVTLAVASDPTRLQVDVSTNRFSELSLSAGSQVSIALPPERILVYSRAD